MTEPFLLSTRALSVLRRARDLVNASMCSRLEQRRDLAVDELRAVVGVEAVEGEGERPQQSVEDRGQAGGVDMLDRADALELGDLIHQVHVVEALDAVQVALMDGIDPHPAGLSERLRAAAFPDRDLHRARRQRRRPAAPLIAAMECPLVNTHAFVNTCGP